MKNKIAIAVLVLVLMTTGALPLFANADSFYQLRVYDDANANGKMEASEEVSVDVQYAFVSNKTCSSVTPEDELSAIGVLKSPFSNSVMMVGCMYYRLSERGVLTLTQYDARRTVTETSTQSPDLLIMRECDCKNLLPMVMRAWSGR